MGKREQHEGESSKTADKRAKRQRLAALAVVRAADQSNGGVRINEIQGDNLEVANSLRDLNCAVRRSPRKHIEHPIRPPRPPVRNPYRTTNPIQPPPSPPSSSPVHTTNATNPIQPPPPPPSSSPGHTTNSIQPPPPPPASNPRHTLACSDVTPSRLPSDSSEGYVLKKPRKKRGRTMLKSLAMLPGEKPEVMFNERGQAISHNSKHLSSYIGTLSREMVPMTISEWKKVDDELRDDLWTCIQSRFKVDKVYKDYLLMTLGQRWKESKSRLVAAIRKASACPDSTDSIAGLKPDNIKSTEEWNAFVKEKMSEKFMKTSQKFKALRAMHKLPHTMSRKGYARLEEEMKKECETSDISRDELWCKAHIRKNGEPLNSVVADCISKIKEHSAMSQSSQGTPSINQDGVSKIFGQEHGGRVRGLGFGVVPSQMRIYRGNLVEVHALRNQVSGLEAKLEELTAIMLDMKEKQTVNEENPETPHANTPQSHRESNNLTINEQPNRNARQTRNESRKCKLLSWEKQVVAEGTVASTDPNCLVHFKKLGPDGCKVWVDVAVDPDAYLWRPNSEMCTIGEAVGSTVAWHKDFLAFD